eukprot:15364496-Ditylum_brightwellii.AAC.1
MGAYNAGGGRCDSHEYLTLGHYFSMLQNVHYFQKTTAVSIMEWLIKMHPVIKELHNSMLPNQPIPYTFYDPARFNNNILPYDAFSREYQIDNLCWFTVQS